MTCAKPKPGSGRGVLAGAAALLLTLLSARISAGAGPRLEQWNADISLRLRVQDNADGELQTLNGSALLRLDPHFHLFINGRADKSERTLPELYLRYENGSQRLSLGRFYLPIGIHDYSELYYVGFILIPMVKYSSFMGFRSYDSERGALWEAQRAGLSWEMALLGDEESRSPVGLERPRGVAGRAQTSLGKLILGLNAYTANEPGHYGRQTVHWYGLDGRFSVPQWVFRSEVFRGSIGGAPLTSAYVDVLYHPTALPKWTFLGRWERVRGRFLYRRYTAGARRVLSHGLTLSVNWIEDHIPYPSDARGLNFQLQRTFQY